MKIFLFCFLLTFAAGFKGERRSVTCHVTCVMLVLRVRRGQGGDIMKTISKCDTTWELLATAHWMKVESSTAMAAVVRMAETE